MTPLETVAVVLALFGVWQTVREDIAGWLTGSLSSALFTIAFFQAKLYSDVGLQFIYILLNAYGWYQWKRGGKDKVGVAIATTGWQQWIVFAMVATAAILAMGMALDRVTDTDVAYWDATTTTLSLVAQYMLAKKLIENWWVWIAANMLYMGVYVYKALYLTSGLQVVFVVLSVMGYLKWKKTWRASRAV